MWVRGAIKLSGKAYQPSPGETRAQDPNEGIALPEKEDMSLTVMEALQVEIMRTNGHHALLGSTTENFRAASIIFSQVRGDIVATCFFECPDYGEHDLAESIMPASRFTRITIRCLCDAATREVVLRRFSSYRCRAQLLVLNDNVSISKVGGIFCKCEDGSHLAFMALNNSSDAKSRNLGLVFRGDIAQQMYRYYDSFIERYSNE